MDEGAGAPPRFRPPPLCQDRTGLSPPSLHRLSRLGDVFCLQGNRNIHINQVQL